MLLVIEDVSSSLACWLFQSNLLLEKTHELFLQLPHPWFLVGMTFCNLQRAANKKNHLVLPQVVNMKQTSLSFSYTPQKFNIPNIALF